MTRLKILAFVASISLVVAGGCGDGEQQSTATTTTSISDRSDRSVDDAVVERVSEAADNTVAEGTARFNVRVETRDLGTTSATTTTARGAGSSDVGDTQLTAEGEVDFEAQQRRLMLEGPEGELEVVIDDDVLYIELPATEDDDWMRIELDRLFDEDLGMGGPALLPFQDPTDNLRVLQGSAVHAQEGGDEEIDGDDTTRYELIIDLQAAAEEATDDVRDAVDEMVTRTGMDELEMEVWIDDDDLIRRVAYRIDLRSARVQETDDEGSVEADPQGTARVVTDYEDFGTSVDIEIPDDENVVDLDEDAVRDSLDGTTSGNRGTTTTAGSGGATTTTSRTDATTTTR